MRSLSLACRSLAQVFPQGLMGVIFPRFRGETWIETGKEPSQGRIYREKTAGRSAPGAVSLVLGELCESIQADGPPERACPIRA